MQGSTVAATTMARIRVAVTRSQIVAEARSWIGTAYHHQASRKGAGCDCVGLVRGVWRFVIGPEPEPAPPYSRDIGEANGEETMLAYFQRHLVLRSIAAAAPGDVLCLRWKPRLVVKHCLIMTDEGRAVHAVNNNPVAEIALSGWWHAKLTHAFSFPGVETP